MYVTRQALRHLTGCARKADQVAWLHARRWVYVIDRDGWPNVDQRYHDKKMGVEAAKPEPIGPDWSKYGTGVISAHGAP